MAFSWVLGRRQKSLEDDVKDETLPPDQGKTGRRQQRRDDAIDLADVKLSIEGGLVMAFGPLGDPIPPQLLKDACARQPEATLQLPDGLAVDRKRLIAVLEAQQAGRLAEHPNDAWIKAMLGAEGGFEFASSACLASEECEGKSVLAGRLVLDMPGGETISLRDAHPGSAGVDRPAKLMVDGKPVSIAELSGLAGRPDHCNQIQGDALQPVSNPVVTVRGDHLAVLLDEKIEARLETTSSVWDGEAKVALFLEDGQPVSIDDLTTSLEDIPPCLPPEIHELAKPYPLISGHELDLDLEHATIVTVSNVPDGWSLTTGKRDRQGHWIFDPSDLKEASVQVSRLDRGPHALHIKVMSSIGRDGTLDQQTCTVVIPPNAEAGEDKPKPFSPAPTEDDAGLSSFALALDQEEISRASRADALLLRGLPKGASVSAGIFDPSLNGWVLKSEHIEALTVRDLDHRSGVVEIELKAFYLDQDGEKRSDVIVSKTMTGQG